MNRTILPKALAVITAVLFLSGCGAANHSSSGGSYKASQAVRSAYSQIGTKYKIGGASPSQGFDCSGLVYWAYRSNGVKVPRITSQQAKAGYAVSRNEAAPGDIVVFRVGGAGTGLHTGIYAGGNNFIHSPKPGKTVKMDQLQKTYWKDKLIGVRRVS